jgi:two-component system, OmpR family, sensor histidine kinase KdpD
VSTAAVFAATALLIGSEADLAFASVTLLFVVVATSTLGYSAGLVAALASSGVLTYYFTPPAHSFAIDQPDDLLALVAFVTASLAVGATVARLNQLRRRSDLAAAEARVRLELTNSLAAGMPPADVVRGLAESLVSLFELARCTIVTGDDRAESASNPPAVGRTHLTVPPVVLDLEIARPLDPSEEDTLAALAAGLATALDRARLDAEAREQRLRVDMDRSRAGFLTAITHDLRTPLATIKAATGALLTPGSALDEEDRRELIEAAYEESARLEGLVTKVLELTRIRSGALHPEPTIVAAPDLVRAAVDRLGPADRTRRIHLDLDPELPAAHVDVVWMEHVIANLLENAMVHDPRASEITVRGAAAGSLLELAVVDHGPGIAPADRERAFEEFVRLRASTDGPGTGLGLAIVRALVTAGGGTVRYEETPGGGATFVVSLPAASEELDDPREVHE